MDKQKIDWDSYLKETQKMVRSALLLLAQVSARIDFIDENTRELIFGLSSGQLVPAAKAENRDRGPALDEKKEG